MENDRNLRVIDSTHAPAESGQGRLVRNYCYTCAHMEGSRYCRAFMLCPDKLNRKADCPHWLPRQYDGLTPTGAALALSLSAIFWLVVYACLTAF